MKQRGKPQKSFAEAADDGHEKEEEAIEKDMDEHRHSNLNQMIREAFPAILQFIKFGMVGAVNTVLSYLITNGCYYLLRLHEQLSNLISFLITVHPDRLQVRHNISPRYMRQSSPQRF